MRDFAISQKPVRKSRMGRPPLNLKPTVVRLSAETIARIEAIAGKGRLAAFLRQAAEAELLRRETGAGGKPRPPKPTKVRK